MPVHEPSPVREPSPMRETGALAKMGLVPACRAAVQSGGGWHGVGKSRKLQDSRRRRVQRGRRREGQGAAQVVRPQEGRMVMVQV